MIRGIIFDCFGVLIESSEAELRRLCAPDKYIELDDIRLQRDRGIINYQTYLHSLSELLTLSLGEVQAITESLHIRNRELFAFIDTIDRSSYKVGLLSNIGDKTLDQLFRPEETAKLFDTMVLSYQVGLVKPEPEIYQLTATRLELTPQECVFVDDAEQNCVAARQQGMKAIIHTDNATTLREIKALL